MKLIPSDKTEHVRTVYAVATRGLAITPDKVDEYIHAEGYRFLACTCDEYYKKGTFCQHIAKVYMERLDVKADTDNLGEPIETVIPCDGIATNVVILGNKHSLNVLVWIKEIPPVPGQVAGMMEVYLSMPDEDGIDQKMTLGITSRNSGRGDIRSLFLEWITGELVLNPLECKQPWHTKHREYIPSLDDQIMDYCNLMKNEMCMDCFTSDEVPKPHQTVTGVWDRDRTR